MPASITLQIRSLFVSSCKHDVIAGLWDVYFSERDPFLVFFLALVMIINAKYDVHHECMC